MDLFKVIDLPEGNGPYLLYVLMMKQGLEAVVVQLLAESYVREFIKYVDAQSENRPVYTVVLKEEYNTQHIRDAVVEVLRNCIAMAPTAYKQRGLF